MSKNKPINKQDIDTTKVSIDNEKSIEYWCAQFNCERGNLIRTVLTVGDSIISVDAYLEMNRLKGDL